MEAERSNSTTVPDLGGCAELVARLAKALRRAMRRVDAVSGDLQAAERAAHDATHAQLFVVAAARAPRGTHTLESTDWSTGDAVRIQVDPTRAPQDSLRRIFHRARRLREALPQMTQRLEDAKRQVLTIQALLDRANGVTSPEGLRELEVEAAPFVGVPAPRVARDPDLRLPYRMVQGSEGLILIGRSAADNDTLIQRFAKPWDLWMHVREGHGAHVVVPLARGANCPGSLLVEAAHLAAHFSDLRGEVALDVLYTPRRYVQKRKGSPAGAVTLLREKVLRLRVVDGMVPTLLGREMLAR